MIRRRTLGIACAVTLSFAVLGIGTVGDAAPPASRPEAIGGKGYSRQHCLEVAKWVVDDPDRMERDLSGADVGSLWYTLDSCDVLYFNHPRLPLAKSAVREGEQMTDALHYAADAYIRSLQYAIMHLPSGGRAHSLGLLRHMGVGSASKSRAEEMPAPWSPYAQECADVSAIMHDSERNPSQALDAEKRAMAEKCIAAIRQNRTK